LAIAYFLSFPDINSEVIKTNDLSFTNCNYKGLCYGYYNCHSREIKVEDIISCHNMSMTDFDDFTKILEDHNYFI